MGAELPRLPLDRRDFLLHVGEFFVRAGLLLRDGLLRRGEIPVPSRVRGRVGLPRPDVDDRSGGAIGEGRGCGVGGDSAVVTSLGITQNVLPSDWASCGRVCRYW